MDTQKPKIPLSVFRKMAHSLPAEELAKLPPERLPDRIPVDFLESLDPEMTATIDELIMTQQMSIMQARKSLAATYGADIARAISLSQRTLDGTAAGDLRRNLVRLRNRRAAEQKEMNINLAAEFLEALESSRETINQMLDDHRVVIAARKLLRTKLFGLPKPDSVLQNADEALLEQSTEICDLAGYYYAERCELCVILMSNYRGLRQQHGEYKQEISRRVNRLTGYPGDVGEVARENDGRKIHGEVRSLFTKMRDHDFVIDEAEITYWLDIVLEFAMFRRKKSRFETLAVRAESLLSEFIKTHFENIEAAHNGLQSDRYAPVPVELGDSFAQDGEAFLNQYFQRKQEELSRQTCISATDRLYALRRSQSLLR